MVLYHTITCKFLNCTRPLPVPQLQLSGWVASIKQSVGFDNVHSAESWSNLEDSMHHLPTCSNMYYDSLTCLEDPRVPKAQLILIGLYGHMLTGFTFQPSVFFIKLAKTNSAGNTELDMLCSHCKMEIDHCWKFCCALYMIVNSLNVPVILWTLTCSSPRFLCWGTSLCLRNPKV